jgi:death on curing protein
MFSVEIVLEIHSKAIELFGGGNGVRDFGALESAINRPFQTFGDDDLYPSVFEKAAAIGESIIMNHPFVDGNKRTGYILLELILKIDGYVLKASTDEIYEFVINISTGAIRFDSIVAWLQENAVQK